MKFRSIYAIAYLSLAMTGCTVISGLQTYDIPSHGNYTTNLGVPVNIIALNQESLPETQTAQQFTPQYYAPLFRSTNTTYTLTPGDILSIQLWAYPEITPPATYTISNEQAAQASGFQIDQNGYIQFPLVGKVKASGKTVSALTQDLHSRLSHYLKTPDVAIRVLSYQGQRFFVHGNVLKGGQYYITDQPLSLYSALSLAGGVTDKGDNNAIQLIRNGVTYDLNIFALEKSGLSLHKLMIRPNDTIFVNSRENQKIYIMGESGKNQALPIRDQGMSLSDVLGESLGIDPVSASAARIYVLRTNNTDHTTAIYHLNLGSLGNFSIANQFKMHSNDIVYIDPTGLTRWQRVISQLLPFGNGLNNIKSLGTR